MSLAAQASPGDEPAQTGHGFGTAPVFLASISTILGAILFLRFGYAVGHVGLWGAMMIIVIGHMVTIPTVLAVSEIATNLRVAGGGAYFIISRSFGTTIGGSIGRAMFQLVRRLHQVHHRRASRVEDSRDTGVRLRGYRPGRERRRRVDRAGRPGASADFQQEHRDTAGHAAVNDMLFVHATERIEID